MGCLNSQGIFSHWFGNIHLSGKCNRSCYFCIGQHMKGVDPIDNLDQWPLLGMDDFLEKCEKHSVKEVNITGSDTDPMLYRHLEKLTAFLREKIPGIRLGIRTNGVLFEKNPELLSLFDKASISITSFDLHLYKQTMGQGSPPPIAKIKKEYPNLDLKINIVLCPETVAGGLFQSDLHKSLVKCNILGIKRVNLREPYGQAHIGDPLSSSFESSHLTLGMPTYDFDGMLVTYWDVHYVEVESVNLYANGLVSETYPVTLGHHPNGTVKDQSHFGVGRQAEQWKNKIRLSLISDPVKIGE